MSYKVIGGGWLITVVLVAAVGFAFGGWSAALHAAAIWALIPLSLVGLFAILFEVPRLVAAAYLRLRLPAPSDKSAMADGVVGFVLPFGWWRMLTSPAEYHSILRATKREGLSSVRLLSQTSGLRLSTRGLADEGFLETVARCDEPRRLLEEAVRLAEVHGSSQVIRYASHPGGPARGFEFLREDVPYEFAEVA